MGGQNDAILRSTFIRWRSKVQILVDPAAALDRLGKPPLAWRRLRLGTMALDVINPSGFGMSTRFRGTYA
jgi:hypothetical protein